MIEDDTNTTYSTDPLQLGWDACEAQKVIYRLHDVFPSKDTNEVTPERKALEPR
jgi:hypothetical protein